MVVYKFLFYKFYSFSEAIGNTGASNEGIAWANTTVFLTCNIASIRYLIEIYFHRQVGNTLFFLLIAILIGFLGYYYSVRKNAFLSYEELFTTTKLKNGLGSIAMVCYCLASIIVYGILNNRVHELMIYK